jgi:hypothetical protein
MNAWRRRAPWPRGLLLALALVLALLHAQGLGLWHRVAHAQRVVLATQGHDAHGQAFAACMQLTASDASAAATTAAQRPPARAAGVGHRRRAGRRGATQG